MPYFWESPKWMKRLDDLKIWHQKQSGYNVYSNYKKYNTIFNVLQSKWEHNKKIRENHQDLGIHGMYNTLHSITGEFFNRLSLAEHYNPDFYIRRLYDILNVSPGDSILEYLIYKPGVARVTMTNELYELRGYMEGFLHKLSDMMANQDSRFEFIPNQMGSMAEETRAGFGDEYDYRLDMKMDFRPVKDLFSDCDMDITKVYKEVNFGSMKFLLEFYPTLKVLLKYLMNTESESLLNFVGYDFNSSGVMYLCFEWRKGNPEKEMLVKVDCVPAIVLHDFWPSSNTSDPLGDPIKPLSHIILKLNTDSQLLHPVWSLSCAEVAFMTNLPDHVKDGYTLCKILMGLLVDSFQLPQTACFEFGASVLPSSYHLKNSLFTCLLSGKISLDEKPDEILQVFDVACSIFNDESKTEFKAFFMAGRKYQNGEQMPYGHMIEEILKDLKKQHLNRSVPIRNKKSSFDVKFLGLFDMMNKSTLCLNDYLDYFPDDSCPEYERNQQSKKMISHHFEVDAKKKEFLQGLISHIIKREPMPYENVSTDNENDTDISLD